MSPSRFAARVAVALGIAAPAVMLASADAHAQHARDSEINLAVGETKTLSARGVSNFGEGDKSIIESTLTTQGDKIVVTARSPATRPS